MILLNVLNVLNVLKIPKDQSLACWAGFSEHFISQLVFSPLCAIHSHYIYGSRFDLNHTDEETMMRRLGDDNETMRRR